VTAQRADDEPARLDGLQILPALARVLEQLIHRAVWTAGQAACADLDCSQTCLRSLVQRRFEAKIAP